MVIVTVCFFLYALEMVIRLLVFNTLCEIHESLCLTDQKPLSLVALKWVLAKVP